jgi:hypothetical protein
MGNATVGVEEGLARRPSSTPTAAASMLALYVPDKPHLLFEVRDMPCSVLDEQLRERLDLWLLAPFTLHMLVNSVCFIVAQVVACRERVAYSGP